MRQEPPGVERGPRCGSTDPAHAARRCRPCKSIYQRRHREGIRDGTIRVPNPATCKFCNLTAGNSQRIKVLRYPLLRHIDKGGRHTSVCIGSLPMCDRCVMEFGNIKDQYLPRRAVAA